MLPGPSFRNAKTWSMFALNFASTSGVCFIDSGAALARRTSPLAFGAQPLAAAPEALAAARAGVAVFFSALGVRSTGVDLRLRRSVILGLPRDKEPTLSYLPDGHRADQRAGERPSPW